MPDSSNVISAERAVIEALRDVADDLEAGLKHHIAAVDYADNGPDAGPSHIWIMATRAAAAKLREKSDHLARELAP